MGSKKKTGIKKHGNDINVPSRSEKVPGVVNNGFLKRYSHFVIPAVIAIATWLCLHVCTDGLFTNWDDPGYVQNDPLIKDLSGNGLKQIFSTSVMGNYHPLLIFMYAIEYKMGGLEPAIYHIDSLLLHILVTIAVYWFVSLLTRRPLAAAITALLFGLHPMHMEPVAWIAGRKDLLYSLFYLAACIFYIRYTRTAKGKIVLYLSVLLLFACSLLSKPVAVALPLTLFIIDHFEGRKWRLSLLLEKIPFLCLAIASGIKAMIDQKGVGALNTLDEHFNFIERIALGSYACITYLWKAIVPAHLLNFYPYPNKINGTLPVVYYIYPVILAAMIFVLWKFGRKNKAVVFGTLFFFVNIALLLQFIPVGGAIVAERYAYLPYLGLFFIAGWMASALFEEAGNKQAGKIALSGIIIYSCLLGYMSNDRCATWHDTISLWRDETDKEPERVPLAWNNLGSEYSDKFKEPGSNAEKKLYFDSAVYCLAKAIELQPSYVSPYVAMGVLMRINRQPGEAKAYYYKALTLKGADKDSRIPVGLANIYAIEHNFDSSAYFFRAALDISSNSALTHNNLGNLYDMMGKADSALNQYALAISQDPGFPDPYFNRGKLLQRMQRCNDAMTDFNKAIEIQPGLGDIYYARSYCYSQYGNKAQALQDVEKAISLGFSHVDNTYYQSLKN